MNFYQILGVAQDATIGEIKASYRKLAKAYHPDHNRGSASEEHMKDINRAYHVLGDPDKRSEYDTNLDKPVRESPSRMAKTVYRIYTSQLYSGTMVVLGDQLCTIKPGAYGSKLIIRSDHCVFQYNDATIFVFNKWERDHKNDNSYISTDGKNLFYRLPMSKMMVRLFNKKIKFRHLNGNIYEVNTHRDTSPDKWHRLKGLGIPSRDGDTLIQVKWGR